MDVRVLDDLAEFADAAGEYVRREPFSANVIATNVEAIRSGARPAPDGAAWILVEEAGTVRGIAMHTPPFPLFVPRLESDAVETLAHALADAHRRLPGVSGECATVARFADVWLERTRQRSQRRTAMRMYVLGDLRAPDAVPGEASRAVPADEEMVASWVEAFHEEAMPGSPVDDWREWSRGRIAQGEVWVWHDRDRPVSMAKSSAPATGVSRVGPVYTPPDRRHRGYGAAVTAVASRAALDGGADQVVLYTDLANPVSNSIYQAIGYVPDHDAEERVFDSTDAS